MWKYLNYHMSYCTFGQLWPPNAQLSCKWQTYIFTSRLFGMQIINPIFSRALQWILDAIFLSKNVKNLKNCCDKGQYVPVRLSFRPVAKKTVGSIAVKFCIGFHHIRCYVPKCKLMKLSIKNMPCSRLEVYDRIKHEMETSFIRLQCRFVNDTIGDVKIWEDG